MKLAKINDVRIGQIYKSKKYNYIHIITSFSDVRYTLSDFYRNGILECENDWELTNSEIQDCELIGFLGITHEKRDNKLVEIPREEFEEDDIILCTNFYRNEYGEIVGQFTKKICYNGYIDELEKLREENDKIKKIGILGVNYEFINNKLVKEND